MKKLLLLFAILFSRCAMQPAFACPSGLIGLVDSAVINAATGQPYTGSLTITLTANSLQGTSTVLGDQQTVPITSGVIDAGNRCISPGRYAVRQRAANSGLTIASVFVVPSSGGPYRLTDVPTGTVNTNGTAVTSASGINFASVATDDTVNIAGSPYVVASVQSATALTLTASAGIQSGVSFSDGPIQQIAATLPLAAMYTGAAGPPGASGTGNAPYSATVTALTTLTVAAAMHGQGTTPVGYCSDPTSHPIACDSSRDVSGNLTFNWPGGFTGSITILGGGTGARGATGAAGATGAPGPTGPMGALGNFGALPTLAGSYCPQVTVTAGPTYAYVWASCSGTLSYASLTNSQWIAMTNLQWTGMGN
jgi:hypothetical protein